MYLLSAFIVLHLTYRQYRFDVLAPPLSIQTTTHQSKCPSHILHTDILVRERTYLQVRLQNTSSRPVRIERLALHSDTWHGQAVGTGATAQAPAKNKETHAALTCTALSPPMQPDDVRQYLFVLEPRDTTPMSAMLTQLAALPPGNDPAVVSVPLGSLKIAWRVPNGEPGKLQIGPFARTSQVTRPVERLYAELYVETATEAIVDQPTLVTLRVALFPLASSIRPVRVVIEPIGTWDSACLLGDAQQEFDMASDGRASFVTKWVVVPLQTSIVRAGGVSLKMLGDDSRVICSWPCIAEWVVRDARS